MTDAGQDPIPLVPASAGALIYDRHGRLLILKPSYKAGWTIPGGMLEADGESPWEACRREVAEETGLIVDSARLAAVDFRPAKPGRIGGLRFLFDCGVLSDGELDAVVLQAAEIEEARLVDLATAFEMLSGPLRRRVRAATRRARCVYLEDGRELEAVSASQRTSPR